MRIVYLVNSKWPRIRGAERLLFTFMERACVLGHKAVVLAPEASALHEACRARGLRSEVVEFSLRPAHVRRLKAVLRELRPEIVHGMSIFPVAFVRRLGLVPAEKRVGCFAFVSVDPTSSLPVAKAHFRGAWLALRNAVARSEAPRLDALFAASEWVAERLEVAGIRGHVVPVPGVIDVRSLTDAAIRPIDLPPGRPRIGYAAFLEKLKGIDDLIVAFARIRSHVPDATLLIAGEGPEQQALAELAEKLGAGAGVHWLGFVDPVAPLFKALDVFVAPSHSEAHSTVLLEAMALGVPCVSTAALAASGVVEDGVNGLVVPTSDPPAIASAVERLIGDPGFAHELGERGRERVLEGPYTLDSTLETVFREYAGAIERRTGSTGS